MFIKKMYKNSPQYEYGVQQERIIPFVAYEYIENFQQSEPSPSVVTGLKSKDWFIILAMIALLLVFLFLKRS